MSELLKTIKKTQELSSRLEAHTQDIKATLRERQGLPPEKQIHCRECGDVGCAICGRQNAP